MMSIAMSMALLVPCLRVKISPMPRLHVWSHFQNRCSKHSLGLAVLHALTSLIYIICTSAQAFTGVYIKRCGSTMSLTARSPTCFLSLSLSREGKTRSSPSKSFFNFELDQLHNHIFHPSRFLPIIPG